MQIDLTNEEAHQLLDLLYLGDWLAAHSQTDDSPAPDYQKLMQTIYTQAADSLDDCPIEFDNHLNSYQPDQAYQETMSRPIAAYNNYAFWKELIVRMAAKDALEAGYGFLSEEEYLNAKIRSEIFYEQEFAKNGLRHVKFIEK